MNIEQIQLVQATFAEIAPHAPLVGELFYGRLFELDPSLRALFQGDMQAQSHKLLTVLSMIVASLNRPETFLPAVATLARRHVGYGVTSTHYATVGQALLDTLRKGLAEQFTPEVEAAWTAAYSLLATVMQTAAASEDGSQPSVHPHRPVQSAYHGPRSELANHA